MRPDNDISENETGYLIYFAAFNGEEKEKRRAVENFVRTHGWFEGAKINGYGDWMENSLGLFLLFVLKWMNLFQMGILSIVLISGDWGTK